MSGGGAAMPEAVAQKLLDMGITYVEGYGMSETIAPTHINPPDRRRSSAWASRSSTSTPRGRPEHLAELPPNEVGEIIVRGPQVIKGYWNNPDATAAAFVEIDGKRFRAPATWPTSTRTATSSWSTASSA
jgi:fatty-acyl-CoA synthase